MLNSTLSCNGFGQQRRVSPTANVHSNVSFTTFKEVSPLVPRTWSVHCRRGYSGGGRFEPLPPALPAPQLHHLPTGVHLPAVEFQSPHQCVCGRDCVAFFSSVSCGLSPSAPLMHSDGATRAPGYNLPPVLVRGAAFIACPAPFPLPTIFPLSLFLSPSTLCTPSLDHAAPLTCSLSSACVH